MFDTPTRTLQLGLGVIVFVLLAAIVAQRLGLADAALLAARAAHIFVAMIWVGLIWFVNVVQLSVLRDADDTARLALMRWVIPRVSTEFRLAANLTALTGLILLAALGYLSHRSLVDSAWMWAGVTGAFAMLGFVHAKITPALRIILDERNEDAARKATARETVRFYARCNLLLAFPVTFAMLAAAHG